MGEDGILPADGKSRRSVKINYITLATKNIAGRRYRMERIGEYIGDYVISQFPAPADIHVMTKPFTKNELILESYLDRAKTLNFIFDISDPRFSDYTKKMMEMALAVTVPTKVMAELVKECSGIEAIIIPDTYEFDEKPIKDISEPKVMWFGHYSNLKYLDVDYPVDVLTTVLDKKTIKSNYTIIPWSIENMKSAFDRNNVVVIPSECEWKSPNRVIESIRQGLSVVASPIDSYKEFDITFNDNMNLDNIKQTTPELQKYVRDNFNISVIGDKWKQLFDRVSSSTLDVAAGF